MSTFSHRMMQKYKASKRSSIIVYFILRIFIIITAISQFALGEIANGLLCIFTLLLFTLPTFLSSKLKIELPNTLEAIIYIFIFAGEILGEIYNFYRIIPFWDTILHIINGFICAGVGFSLVDILNQKSKRLSLSPIYIAIVAFCFSMTVGVLWEFGEYAVDNVYKADGQKDNIVKNVYSIEINKNGKNTPVVIENIKSTIIETENGNVIMIDGGYLDIGLNDTMKDLLVNFLGASVFSIIGYIYIKKRKMNGFVGNFIPKRI